MRIARASPPARGRGSKPRGDAGRFEPARSPPARGRGSKRAHLRRGGACLSRLADGRRPRRDRIAVAARREGRPGAHARTDFDSGGGQVPAGGAVTVRRKATARLLPELTIRAKLQGDGRAPGALNTTGGADEMQPGLKKQQIGVINNKRHPTPARPCLRLSRTRCVHGRSRDLARCRGNHYDARFVIGHGPGGPVAYRGVRRQRYCDRLRHT